MFIVKAVQGKASVEERHLANCGDMPALVAAFFYLQGIGIEPALRMRSEPGHRTSSPRQNIVGLLTFASRDLDHMHTGSKIREVHIAGTSARAVFRLACGRRYLPALFDRSIVIGHRVCARGRR
jgi:hypothetical protein